MQLSVALIAIRLQTLTAATAAAGNVLLAASVEASEAAAGNAARRRPQFAHLRRR